MSRRWFHEQRKNHLVAGRVGSYSFRFTRIGKRQCPGFVEPSLMAR